MAINSSLSADGKTMTLHVNGRFDFSCHQGFVAAYKEYPKGDKYYVVDLKNADHLDSSAMGMLLQLRDYSNKEEQVKIRHPHDGVSEVLKIANFDKLFTIEA